MRREQVKKEGRIKKRQGEDERVEKPMPYAPSNPWVLRSSTTQSVTSFPSSCSFFRPTAHGRGEEKEIWPSCDVGWGRLGEDGHIDRVSLREDRRPSPSLR